MSDATIAGTSSREEQVVESSRRDEEVVEILQYYSPRLWALTLVFFVVGDLLTTWIGLSGGGVAEVGPLVGPLLDQYGLLAMLPLKAVAVGACYLLWRVTPDPYSVGVPLGLGVFGVLVTGWNAGVLVVAFAFA